jgi:carboxylate-amine ligase
VIVTGRTVGVEEEFLLVDVATGLQVAAADSVAQWATAMGQGGTIDHELTLQQVETATGITTDLPGLRSELVGLRRGAAEAAAAAGTVLLATGTSPVPFTARTTPSPRYHRMTEMYGLTAR